MRKVEEMGVEMPKYYRPGAVNPLNYAEQECILYTFHYLLCLSLTVFPIKIRDFLTTRIQNIDQNRQKIHTKNFVREGLFC